MWLLEFVKFCALAAAALSANNVIWVCRFVCSRFAVSTWVQCRLLGLVRLRLRRYIGSLCFLVCLTVKNGRTTRKGA